MHRRCERRSRTPAAIPTLEGEICLLKGTNVAAGYQKVIRGMINTTWGDRTAAVYTKLIPRECDPPRIVSPGQDNFVMLVVQNHGHTAVQLEKGIRLGTVIPVELVPLEEGTEEETREPSGQPPGNTHELEERVEGTVCRVDATRTDEVLTQIDLKLNNLTIENSRPSLVNFRTSCPPPR